MNAARSRSRSRNRRLRRGGQLLVFVVALGLVGLDARGQIDLSWQAVALFAVALVVVLLEDLEELEVGEFGSIRLREDLDRAKRRVDALGARPAPAIRSGEGVDGADADDDRSGGEPVERVLAESADANGSAARTNFGDSDALTAQLRDLVATDPRYALVRLRVELERALEDLDAEAERESDREGSDLEELLEAHESVRGVCDRAIHSRERVDREEALRAIELGVRLLEHLRCRTEAAVAERDSAVSAARRER